MTDELEVLNRLVDYHDHIAPPTVPVADDVRRGRRRVRRTAGHDPTVATHPPAAAPDVVGDGDHGRRDVVVVVDQPAQDLELVGHRSLSLIHI